MFISLLLLPEPSEILLWHLQRLASAQVGSFLTTQASLPLLTGCVLFPTLLPRDYSSRFRVGAGCPCTMLLSVLECLQAQSKISGRGVCLDVQTRNPLTTRGPEM